MDVLPRCSAYLPLDKPPQNTGICLPYFCHSVGKDPMQDNNHEKCSAQCLVKNDDIKISFFFFPERNERFLPHLGRESPHTSVACRNSPLCSLQMVSWRYSILCFCLSSHLTNRTLNGYHFSSRYVLISRKYKSYSTEKN